MQMLSVYFVTDENLCATVGRSVCDTVRGAVDGGATCIQLRAKDDSAADFLAQTVEVCSAVNGRVPVIINDRVDVFLAARHLGAKVDGVHVGQSDLPVEAVRALVGPEAILGLSASTEDEIRAAEESGVVDYLGIGVLRGTVTKADAPGPLGVEGLDRLARLTTLPTVAIGGIGHDDMADLGATALDGAALVSAICCAEDPAATVAGLVSEWQRGRASCHQR